MNKSNRVSMLLAACGLAGMAASASAQDIRITEIMYNPASNPDNNWEYVEIFNAGGSSVDLTGWVLDDIGGAPVTAANIPGGVVPAGTTAVLYNSILTLAEVQAAWGTGINFIPVNNWQALNNSGVEQFGLWSSITSHAGRDFSTAVVQVTYNADGQDGWPLDDGIASIYMPNPYADGNVGTNWQRSTVGIEGAYASNPAGTGPDVNVGSPGINTQDTIQRGPFLVNISGATLFASFFEGPTSTNDYFDVDLDGFARRFGPGIDQLAPAGQRKTTYDADAHWIVTYRSTGSVKGFEEFVLTNDPDGPFASTGFYDTTRDDDNPAIGLRGLDAENAIANRELYRERVAGPIAGVFNAGNPGGSPFRSLTDGTFRVSPFTFPATSSAGGVRIDLAIVDVPSSWAVRIPGSAVLNRTPGSAGYGDSDIIPVNKDGTPAAGNSKLPDLGGLRLFDPANPPAPTATDVVFDTPIAFSPVAAMVNYGVGLQEITMSDLRHGSATGRRKNGENLVFSTRDVGSGTRNAFQNSIGLDPSWGRGENVGARENLARFNILGPDFLPSNKGGSGSIEDTVINHRLAIGHSGAERANRWFFTGRADVLAVQNDLQGGTVFARPTIENILTGGPDGYTIGGLQTFSSVGSPRAVRPSLGGEIGTGLPPIENEQAAAYLNNITRSIAAFVDDPTVPAVEFTPAEFLARNFALVGAISFVQDLTNPLVLFPNPDLNPDLQAFTLENSDVLGDPRFATFGGAGFDTGLVPNRTTGVTYSDGVIGGGNYVDQAGRVVLYGSRVTARNRLAGDFNNDGVRDIRDIPAMVSAFENRASFQSGTDLVLEIIGDFNGDGNFDLEDIRYFADGLAIDPVTGKLDRMRAFELVDESSTSGNLFGTIIGDGSISYQAGWSRFDVSNENGLTTPGWGPTAGADGVVDIHDRDYIVAQLNAIAAVSGNGDWSDTFQAVFFDLSADMTGDLFVNQDDLDAIDAVLGGVCRADIDGDGQLTIFDFLAFQNLFAVGDLRADFDGDGQLTIFDFLAFQNEFAIGC
ncbi:MAG: lamin tail domain-containing protein [Phycisphaeraceae bacterium]|nr:lamin tail domain-containing protein [Phycisphaeraceae bacterium]